MVEIGYSTYDIVHRDMLEIGHGRKLPAGKRFFHEAKTDTFCSLLNVVHLKIKKRFKF